ncbi:MAG: glycosyltransferase family A protein [Pseudomonadota bacterium]
MAIDYSVVLTSCGRFDLLDRTLESLLPRLDPVPHRFVLIEDSTDTGVEAVAARHDFRGAELVTIVNETQLGQMRAIDRAYARVETPYVLHCEDDWSFTRPFVAEAHRILEARDDVSIVLARDRATMRPEIQRMATTEVEGIAVLLMDPRAHPEYFGMSFNPGLWRLTDYQALAPLAALGHEADVSLAMKQRGKRSALLLEPAYHHIGDDAHVHDPTQPAKARTLPARLRRSVRKRVKRLARWLGGTS